MAIDYDYLKKRFLNDGLRIFINQLREYPITPKDVYYGIPKGVYYGMKWVFQDQNLLRPTFDDKVITLTDDHIRFLRGELFDDLEGEKQK